VIDFVAWCLILDVDFLFCGYWFCEFANEEKGLAYSKAVIPPVVFLTLSAIVWGLPVGLW
jgi:hypothetical protein